MGANDHSSPGALKPQVIIIVDYNIAEYVVSMSYRCDWARKGKGLSSIGSRLSFLTLPLSFFFNLTFYLEVMGADDLS